MDRITSLAPSPDLQARTQQPEAAPPPAEPRPGVATTPAEKSLVLFDEDAGRFVHTLTDARTQETILQYPSESQLAYSRAVMAYLRALAPNR